MTRLEIALLIVLSINSIIYFYHITKGHTLSANQDLLRMIILLISLQGA